MAIRERVRYTKAANVTPNDTTDLTKVADALWVGGAGNIAVILENDTSEVVLNGAAAGQLIQNIRVKRVLATNTTATNIVALF